LGPPMRGFAQIDWNLRMTSAKSSGSSAPASAVEPTRSDSACKITLGTESPWRIGYSAVASKLVNGGRGGPTPRWADNQMKKRRQKAHQGKPGNRRRLGASRPCGWRSYRGARLSRHKPRTRSVQQLHLARSWHLEDRAGEGLASRLHLCFPCSRTAPRLYGNSKK
jgi:hypothetical protein